MKKVLCVLLCLLVLCAAAALPVTAADESRLVDGAALLTDTQAQRLQAQLDEISQRQQLDVVIVTTNTLDGSSPRDYADDFFDYNGYGFGTERDGILLLISMEDRDWWMSTSGYGITAFTDAGIDYISQQILPALSDGDYAGAFEDFADLCDSFITQARNGTPYDRQSLPKEPFSLGTHLLVALAVGIVVSLIVTAVMKGQLKSVRKQDSAGSYIRQGSMRLTQSHEFFLYRHVDRTQKQSSSGGSGVHRSSSGRSHGGGGGKF